VYTTPAPEGDITAITPELSAWRRTAVRLHPRPGNPREVNSHIGGPMLGLKGFSRPACEEHPMDHGGRLMPRPMESVAQFFWRDIPEIPYPEGCDLLQVYWCPNRPACAAIASLKRRRAGRRPSSRMAVM